MVMHERILSNRSHDTGHRTAIFKHHGQSTATAYRNIKMDTVIHAKMRVAISNRLHRSRRIAHLFIDDLRKFVESLQST